MLESNDVCKRQVPFTRLERERVAFSWWGIMLWNSIPAGIRDIPSIRVFRDKYTEYLIQKLVCDVEFNFSAKFYDFV
jgi:hypothetical protein